MISTETRNAFIRFGLPTVPEDDGPKKYRVICKTADDWKYIHKLLIEESTSEEYVPDEKCECYKEHKSIPKMGSYSLTDAQVERLKQHDKVLYVEIDQSYYSGTYKGLYGDYDAISYRYSSTVKNQRALGGTMTTRSTTNTFVANSPGSDLLARSGYNRLRHSYQANPWLTEEGTLNSSAIIDDRVPYRGDGSDTDIIIFDDAGWFGHIEFIKTGVGEPETYRGGNVLPGGGVCGVLDVVLDAPYYIDPDFFNADAENRLMSRWDGTTVPVESYARSWWGTESTSTRSAKFVSTDLGGTATIGSNEDFGTITWSNMDFYTRERFNGSNTSRNTITDSYHSVPVMSQAYGKTHGLAYNSNKWYICNDWNAIGSIEAADDVWSMVKVFHQLKPNNPSYGTKDPTLMSNSWAYSRVGGIPDEHYYYYRGDTTGVYYDDYTDVNMLAVHLNGKMPAYHSPINGSAMGTMVEAAIDAGVLVFCSAGNNRYKCVKSTHSDYSNYVHYNQNQTLTSSVLNTNHMLHRGTFPYTGGEWLDTDSSSSTYNQVVNRTFVVGGLMDTGSSGLELKHYESSRGNLVDFYTGGWGSMGAWDSGFAKFERNDPTYTIGEQTSLESHDCWFGGTSSSSPVAAGLIATKMQWNRNWTWKDVKNWISTSVTNQSSLTMYQGAEPTTATDSEWTSVNGWYSLLGGERKILWDAASSGEPSTYGYHVYATSNMTEGSISEGDSVTFNIVVTGSPTLNGTRYYSLEGEMGTTFTSGDTGTPLSGSISISNNSATFTVSTTEDLLTEGAERFRIRIREGSTTGTIVATSEYIKIADVSVTDDDPPAKFDEVIERTGLLVLSNLKLTHKSV